MNQPLATCTCLTTQASVCFQQLFKCCFISTFIYVLFHIIESHIHINVNKIILFVYVCMLCVCLIRRVHTELSIRIQSGLERSHACPHLPLTHIVYSYMCLSLTLDIAVIHIEVLQTVAQQGLSVVHDHMDIAFVVVTSIHVSLFFLSLQTKSTRSGLAEGGE